ncbi:DUF6941 family protein [Candidatus Palauibacter sp.]|uniref:DUF6941 family protein n=1 Tax=Candidatus Palauibacter sp. TaxID=3101350 RepID=UPI003B02DC29
MEVSLAVLADYVVVSRDQKLSILGIFTNINGVQAPGPVPNCFIVIVMELAAVEANREHEVEIRCMDADGAPVFDATGKFVASNVTTGNAIRANHVMQLGPHIQLPRFGDYSISIIINNDLKKEISFSFMQVQPPEPPQLPTA